MRARAKSEGRTLYLRDKELTGFGAVATKTGACSYFIEYGGGKDRKRMTIGKHGALTPDEARKAAKAATFRQLVERYAADRVEEQIKKRTRYWAEKQARLLADDTKDLHKKLVASIRR